MTHPLRLVVLASALTVGTVAGAEAHAHLTSSAPAMGAILAAAPVELDLGFSEGINPKFTGVTVTGPGKAAVSTGAAKLGPAGDLTLVVPVTGTLAPGLYTVKWHALATDGHKTSGSYTFSIAP